MGLFKWLLVSLMLLGAGHASAFLDATDSLQGRVVVEAGDVEQLRCPPHGKYDCLTWPRAFYKFRRTNTCFVSTGASCGFSCKGFIAADQFSRDFYQRESIGDGLVKHSVTLMQCPDMH